GLNIPPGTGAVSPRPRGSTPHHLDSMRRTPLPDVTRPRLGSVQRSAPRPRRCREGLRVGRCWRSSRAEPAAVPLRGQASPGGTWGGLDAFEGTKPFVLHRAAWKPQRTRPTRLTDSGRYS